MKMVVTKWHLAFLAALLAGFLQAVSAAAETKVGSSAESRVILGLQVNEAAAQAWLPEGWTLTAIPKGPLAGANLVVSFIDWHLARDGQGKPEVPPQRRAVATVAYATREGVEGVRTYVTRIYETPPVIGPYGNSVPAGITRSSVLEEAEDGTRRLSERWGVSLEGGGALSLDLSYQAGTPAWSAAESQPYSSVDPAFHRIYRFEQLVDLAMSAPMGKPLKGDISFRSSVPELAAMFDGSEVMIGAMAIPIYIRETFLP